MLVVAALPFVASPGCRCSATPSARPPGCSSAPPAWRSSARPRRATDIRRQVALNLGGTIARAWIVGGAILAVGLAGEREDGLTAAVLVFVAFTVYFAMSLILHTVARRSK